ncbi:MAG: T9SS type A sorting domain-containing protein [Bacteroidota bacterium]
MRQLFTFAFAVLFTASAGWAQAPLPAIGSDATFEVATWNIEWFGSTSSGPFNEARQLENAQAIIEESDIDLWGVQEIADQEAFNQLLDGLGSAYAGVLATQSGQQRIGFIYKPDVVQVTRVRHILTSFNFEFAGRPPLELQATITIGEESVPMTFVVVHMKAFGDRQSYERRVEASERLKSRFDILQPNDNIILLGDYNDRLVRSTYSGTTISPYKNFVDDTDDYLALTLPLEEQGQGSFCSNSTCTVTGTFLDHITITNDLVPMYIDESVGVLTGVSSRVTAFGNTTSDHLPVYARFDLSATNTSVEEVPTAAQLEASVYPNPLVGSQATLRYTLTEAGPVTVRVFDVLGREVYAEERLSGPGEHRQALDLDGQAPGVYLVRVEAREGQTTLRLVR